MEHEKPYSVYVKTDETGRIVAINSDAFLSSTDGWEKIAEGHGDKFHHAQGNYLPMPVYDEEGHANWKLEGGQPVMRTDAGKEADPLPDAAPSVSGDAESRIAELERLIAAQDQQIAMLLEGVTEDE